MSQLDMSSSDQNTPALTFGLACVLLGGAATAGGYLLGHYRARQNIRHSVETYDRLVHTQLLLMGQEESYIWESTYRGGSAQQGIYDDTVSKNKQIRRILDDVGEIVHKM